MKRNIVYFLAVVCLLFSCKEMEMPTLKQGNLNDIKGVWKAANREQTSDSWIQNDRGIWIAERVVETDNTREVEFQIDDVSKIIVRTKNTAGDVTGTQEFSDLKVSYNITSRDGLDDVHSINFFNPNTPHLAATDFVGTYSFTKEGNTLILQRTNQGHNRFWVYKAVKQ